MTDKLRIYVACLASYNSGRLYGAWIDVDGKSADEIQNEVNVMLRGSPEPNVLRVECRECGHIQDYIADDSCDECRGDHLNTERQSDA